MRRSDPASGPGLGGIRFAVKGMNHVRRKLLAPLIGSFALVPMVGCEVLLVSGHLGNAASGRRGGAVGVVDHDESGPTGSDRNADGNYDRLSEPSLERE